MRVLFVIFNIIPVILFKLLICDFSKSKRKLIRKNIQGESNKANKEKNKSLNIIKLLYNVDKNTSTLINSKESSTFYQENGLSFVLGIRGIFMIFFLFGSLYRILFTSPLSQQNGKLYLE